YTPPRHPPSFPTRRSSDLASPKRRSRIAATTADSASALLDATTTPLPAASPSALRTTGNPNAPARTSASASSADSHVRNGAVGRSEERRVGKEGSCGLAQE